MQAIILQKSGQNYHFSKGSYNNCHTSKEITTFTCCYSKAKFLQGVTTFTSEVFIIAIIYVLVHVIDKSSKSGHIYHSIKGVYIPKKHIKDFQQSMMYYDLD